MTSPSSGNHQDKPRQSPGRRPSQRPGPGEEPTRPSFPSPLLVFLVFGAIVMFFWYQRSPSNKGISVDYSYFWGQLKADNVEKVHFYGDVLTGEWKEIPQNPPTEKQLEEQFNTTIPSIGDHDLMGLLKENEVKVTSEQSNLGAGASVLFWVSIIGLFFIMFFFWYMLRRSADPMGSGMLGNFVRSPAKRFQASEQQTTFDDVAAMDQAKAELQEVVEFLKTPSKFQRLGAEIPKGILLVGPPGTGKTLLSRATAGEAGVPFFSINGSEFIQMFVGVGASRVRDMFRTAKENAPCILFIDEIDAVGRVRGAGVGGGHDEREQTLNQILSEMDGFTKNEAVIVIAATNRPDVLDPALLRPGRFDRHVTIDRPTRAGRFAILKVHCRKVPLSDNVNLEKVAVETIGFSGADLRNLVNEAALNATRMERDAVAMDDFESARDKVIMGPRREEVLNEHEREMTAYHEAGHALLAWLLPDADLVHKVTIIPRGKALGVTQLMPDEDRYSIGERRLHSQLIFMMGGRSAEKLVFDEYSAGAEDDLKKSTLIARRMVAHWGMSDVIGPVAFRQGEEHPFLGREMHEHREFSEETARIIDQEVQRFLTDAADRSMKLLTDHRDKLDTLAQALLDKESLSTEEMTELLGEAMHLTVGNGKRRT